MFVIYSKENHIATITLNRPESGNLVNQELADELADVCRLVEQDDEVYLALITGAGKAFCTGSELSTGSACPAEAIAGITKPVIAAINGDAIGLGLELALACDVRLAEDSARFGLLDVAHSAIPMYGGTQRLPRIVGRAKALEMLFLAELINAQEAYEIGLVNKIIHGSLASEASNLAKNISSKGPVALRFIKEAVNKGLDLTLEQGLRLEGDLYFILQTTSDRTEGIQAFLERKSPEFKGQ